ncbi:hypothetical protein M3M38_04040 [Fructilactobacillus cliffordii]|uniref:hypothetical protein n=1 Tax=Fructilactobacillus cliffordii TaxID=2940299 RepID=UPI00209241DA|nr:hypothetical protein [Fructilactobacillus cliffordii]USS85887.1 hypothetical protein M3M38_04040 [Fructilactobacillus cliffordii]
MLKIFKDNPLNLKTLTKMVIFFLAILSLFMSLIFITDFDTTKVALIYLHPNEPIITGLIHDVVLAIIILFLALIPIPKLFMVVPFLNALVFGFIFPILIINPNTAIARSLMNNMLNSILVLLSFLIACTIANFVNVSVCKKVYKHQSIRLKDVIKQAAKLYFLYAFPVLIISLLFIS